MENSRVKDILNSSERMILNDLKRSSVKEKMNIFPQQNISSVIDLSSKNLSGKERRTYNYGSFDFVITDLDTKPLFIIEFDGPDHERIENKISDLRKMSICNKAKMPIIRIPYAVYDKFSKDSLIDFLVTRYFRWIDEKGVLDEEFSEKIRILDAKGYSQEDIQDYIIVEDPDIVFNYKYYFPQIDNIIEKLITEYKLYPEYLEAEREFDSKISYDGSSEAHPINGMIENTYKYKVEGILIFKNYEEKINNIYESDKVCLKWMYRIDNEILESGKESGVNSQEAYYNGIPGTKIYDLGSMLAHLNCLEKIYNDVERISRNNKNFIGFKNDSYEEIDLYLKEIYT